jgi:hypothetical protein
MPRAHVARALMCALSLSSLASGAPSPAQESARQKARTLYADGQKALEGGNVEGAQKDFEEAYRILPNAAVLLKIAECRIRRSDFRGAVGALEQYLRDRPDAPDRAEVEGKVSDLRKKPGFVSVTTVPPGASIWVDGIDTERTTPSAVGVSPGTHTVVVKLPSHETAENTVVVEFDSKKELALTLHESNAAPSAGNDASNGDSSGSGYHPTTPFWIAVGTTAVGAVVTTTFGIIALNQSSEYQTRPTQELYDAGRRNALIADISLGVTAAAAATATILFFTSKGPEKRPGEAFILAPSVGSHGGGLVGHVRF